jgi:hypothetical protein
VKPAASITPAAPSRRDEIAAFQPSRSVPPVIQTVASGSSTVSTKRW